MGDLNGDGHRDIVWQHTDGWLAVWYLKGTQVLWGTLLSVNRVPDLEWKIRAVGDTNGDGMADLLWQRQSSGDLAVWYMNGTQVLEVHILSIPKMPPSANWQMQAAADVNGDGRSDVLWRNTATGEVAVWYLNGRMVEATYLLTIGPLTDMNWTIAGAQDVNGDGKADILWQHSTGSLAAWYLNGPTVTATPWLNPNAVASPAWGIAGPK